MHSFYVLHGTSDNMKSGIEALRDAFGIIGRTIRKDIRVTRLNEHEALEMFEKDSGMSELVAKYIIMIFKMRLRVIGPTKILRTRRQLPMFSSTLEGSSRGWRSGWRKTSRNLVLEMPLLFPYLILVLGPLVRTMKV